MLESIPRAQPDLRHVFADGGDAGPKLRDALKGEGNWTIEIVKRSDIAKGFEIIPKLGRRTRLCLVELMPQIGQRLGEIDRKLKGVDTYCPYQNTHAKNRKVL